MTNIQKETQIYKKWNDRAKSELLDDLYGYRMKKQNWVHRIPFEEIALFVITVGIFCSMILFIAEF